MNRSREELIVGLVICILGLIVLLSACSPAYSLQWQDCEFYTMVGCPQTMGVYPSQDLMVNPSFMSMYGWSR